MATHRTKQNQTWIKVLAPLVILIGVIIGALYIIKSELPQNNRQESHAEIQPGKILPDFSLTKLSGESIHISDLKAKVILVNFWATWCDACMEEMPSIVELREHYKNKGFEVVGINLDEKPEISAPKALQDLKIGFPIFKDPDGKTADFFDVHAIPLTVIIDHQRKILLMKDGEQNWNTPAIQSELERWLAG